MFLDRFSHLVSPSLVKHTSVEWHLIMNAMVAGLYANSYEKWTKYKTNVMYCVCLFLPGDDTFQFSALLDITLIMGLRLQSKCLIPLGTHISWCLTLSL
jgi:hypothetical protein